MQSVEVPASASRARPGRRQSRLHNRAGRLRRLLVVLLSLALVATACGGSSDDDSTESSNSSTAEETTAAEPTPEPEPTAVPDEPDPEPASTDAEETDPEPVDEPDPEPIELTASFRGVTEDTIHVGISMLDFAALAELGLVEAGWGDQQQIWQIYIDDLNARGGINGRMIQPYFSYYSPLGTEAATTTCIELTEDVETFAVLGGFLGPAATENNCITTINDTILINGVMTPERLEQAEAPWVQAGAMDGRRLELLIDLLNTEGMLQGKRIVIVGSVERAEAAEQAEGVLAARGVEAVRYITNDVPQGQIQAENDAWSVYAERILADDADAVLIIGSSQAALRGIFNAGLDVERWVLEVSDLSNLGAETPKEMADGAITITGMTDQERWEHSVTTDCRAVVTAADSSIPQTSPNDLGQGEEAWFNPIINYCGWLYMFELIATEAGPDLTQDSFAAAIERVGSFESAGIPFASFGPGKFDAGDAFRLGVFDPDASDAGEVVALTDILDGTP